MTALAALLLAAAPVSLTAVRDGYPNLSPDGSKLVFHSNRLGTAIWIADADGSNARVLYDGRGEGEEPGTPVWSPDGRRIAFAMKPAGAADENESEVYVMDADGRNVRRLTRTPGDDSHPHWSADGRRIFFNSARATPDLKAPWSRQWIDIYSMAADGSDLRRHSDCKSVCTYPVPSPDGRFVVHRRVVDTLGQNWDLSPGARNSEVFVTPLDGSAPVNVSNSPAFDGWPTWSPNGRWVVFASNRDKVAYTGQIYAVRADGKDMRRLTEGLWSRVQPSFGATGNRLYVYESLENADFELGHVASVPIALPD
jgi:TolB protein